MSYHDNNILSIYLYINLYILANSTLNVTPLSKFRFVIYDYELTCYSIWNWGGRLSINKEGEEVLLPRKLAARILNDLTFVKFSYLWNSGYIYTIAPHPKTWSLSLFCIMNDIVQRKIFLLLSTLPQIEVTSLFQQWSRRRQINKNIALLLQYLGSAKMQLPHYYMGCAIFL